MRRTQAPSGLQHRRLFHVLALVAVVSAAFAGVVGTRPRVASAAEVPIDANGMPSTAFFPETGHHLSGEFLTAWTTTGGLMTYGYPISEPMTENGRLVQYFERARFELWPEYTGTQWVVQGTLLGRWATTGREKQAPFKPLPAGTVSDDPNRVIFSETGHSLAYGFKQYWDDNGGLYRFGYPISEEFTENGFTVQYFERARFEWHPENVGTPYAVLLGLLGRDLAVAKKVDMNAVTQSDQSVTYDAGLFDPRWTQALRPPDGGVTAFVSVGGTFTHSAPSPDAPEVDDLYYHRPVVLTGLVKGDPQDGIDAWYVVGPGEYISAHDVDPLVVTTPPQTFDGHWIDVNLSDFWAVAYDGDTPIHAVIFVAGREDRTPLGVFSVMYRVEDEIMDSATVGIPKGSPGYYYLENVLYTQYFHDGGFALHGNYWTPESNFGNFTSNGCVGMLDEDALYMWNFLYIGSAVSIHW